jgi:hypothetical protein
MKKINLEAELTLNEMAWDVCRELKNKSVKEGDLIQKNGNNLGVVLNADEMHVGIMTTPMNGKIMIIEFGQGNFSQRYETEPSKEYLEYKSVIERAYQEATK